MPNKKSIYSPNVEKVAHVNSLCSNLLDSVWTNAVRIGLVVTKIHIMLIETNRGPIFNVTFIKNQI